jgi:hypothetical protein
VADAARSALPEKIGLVDADTGERFIYRMLNTRARALAALAILPTKR